MTLLERLLKRVHKRLFILLSFFMVQFSFAGLLDSIIIMPQLPSEEDAEKIQAAFEEDFNNCYLPGTILYYKSDSTCYSPVQAQINTYKEYLRDEKNFEDPNHQLDKLYLSRFRLAMYTYSKFSETKNAVKKEYDFSHSIFLEYLEEEEDIKEKSWLVKLVERLIDFFNKYVLEPFYRFIVTPLAKLSFFWKTILFIIAIAIFLFVVVFVGRFAARFYPDVDFNKKRHSTVTGRTVSTEINWLQRAREKIDIAAYAEASDFLYRYLIAWSLDRNRVRRYEWWTNGQFLNIIRKRFAHDFDTVKGIINLYEQVMYGHTEPKENDCKHLVSKAGALEGKKS